MSIFEWPLKTGFTELTSSRFVLHARCCWVTLRRWLVPCRLVPSLRVSSRLGIRIRSRCCLGWIGTGHGYSSWLLAPVDCSAGSTSFVTHTANNYGDHNGDQDNHANHNPDDGIDSNHNRLDKIIDMTYKGTFKVKKDLATICFSTDQIYFSNPG